MDEEIEATTRPDPPFETCALCEQPILRGYAQRGFDGRAYHMGCWLYQPRRETDDDDGEVPF